MRPLVLHREGAADGRTLFFVHGWPDDHRIWDRQVDALGDRFHCVRVTLPSYGAEGDTGGLDFPELADAIAAAIDSVCEERGAQRVVLIGHDWGAYLAYMVEQRRPERIERLVTIDVGGHVAPTRAREAAMIAGYQLPLAAAWLARRALPRAADRLTQSVAKAVGAPLDNRAAPLTAASGYPYFYLWRGLLTHRNSLLRRYEPQRPLLYIYGERKPLMFHSQRWLSMLARRDDCEVLPIDGGHWLTLSHPAEVNQAIMRFVRPP